MVFIQRFEEDAGVLFDKLVEQIGDPIQYTYPKLAIWEFDKKERIKDLENYPFRRDYKFQTETIKITLDGKNKKLFVDGTIMPMNLFSVSNESINQEFDINDVLEIEDIIEWIINLPRKPPEEIRSYTYPTTTTYGWPTSITSTTTTPYITYTT